MHASLRLGADFSTGCFHPAPRSLIAATHPPPLLDSRIDSDLHYKTRCRRCCRPRLASRIDNNDNTSNTRFPQGNFDSGSGTYCVLGSVAFALLGAVLVRII